jgi:hypothetical protein
VPDVARTGSTDRHLDREETVHHEPTARRPRTWPWRRLGFAYGFTLVGASLTLCLGMLVSTRASSSGPVRTPTVETSERFRPQK